MDKIAVIDFGGQYCHLIANRIRRLGVYSEIKSPDAPPHEFSRYKGIIFSGGPQSVYAKNAPSVNPGIFKLGIPILGICYGHQLIAHLLNGKVSAGSTKEYGLASLRIIKSMGIFRGFSKKTISVWMSHGDSVAELPSGFRALAGTQDVKFAAFGHPKANIYGIQFHAEVTHTPQGMKILSNFLDICGCERDWSMEKFLKQEISLLKERAEGKKIFFLVSGGVDSTVAFTLLNRALGPENLYGLFVDTGFMRENEGVEVKKSLKTLGFKNFHVYNAEKDFFRALKGIVYPEKKRKIIGDLFIKIQKRAVKKLNLNPEEWLLGQGTIYPDTIETGGTKLAAKIKTHHNRVPEIQEMIKQGLVIEPLKDLYKDEVRAVGLKLGLPQKIVWRHPFPGPALAVRILCKDVEAAAPPEDIYLKLQQVSAKILPIKSVGVQGDERTYRHPAVIFSAPKNWDKIEKISTSITNRFKEVNRVCIPFLNSPKIVIKVNIAYLTKRRVKLLQEADFIVRKFIENHGLQKKIWQFPVVLAPVSFNGGRETIILRPIQSEEAMTANFYKMPWRLLKKLAAVLLKLKGVSAVLYDITNKPPGTIEWE